MMRAALAIGLVIAGSAASVAPTASAALGPPGSLLGSTSIPGPRGGSAWRIRYVSTGLDGKPIEVTGAVIAPREAGQNRPVVAWAHGTTGVGERCAPSLRGPLAGSIDGLSGSLSRGYVVAATDYPGLGTPGPHPYLVGISEGRAVLDSVRAARQLPAGAGARFVPWGTSQGGHAALFAGALAKPYAPELSLVGIAASAPPTNLEATVLYHLEHKSGNILAAMVLWSWSRVYHAPLEPILSASSRRKLGLIARICYQKKLDVPVAALTDVVLGRKFVDARVPGHGTWSRLFAENAPPASSYGVPLFITQGTADKLVPPPLTAKFAQRLCGGGARLQYEQLAGVEHVTVGPASTPHFLSWVADRFAGKAATGNCASRPWLTG